MLEEESVVAQQQQQQQLSQVDGGGMFGSVTSLVGRAASAASSVIPKSTAAPVASLAELASRADAGETAAALTAAAYAGKVGVAALSATGVGLPIAGALGVVMLVAYTVNKMIKENAKLQGVLADVLTIISNCYTIDQLINRTLGICTIALFGGEDDIAKLLTKQAPQLEKQNIATTAVSGGDGTAPLVGNQVGDGTTAAAAAAANPQVVDKLATDPPVATTVAVGAMPVVAAAVANADTTADKQRACCADTTTEVVAEFNEEVYDTLLASAFKAKRKAYMATTTATTTPQLTLMKLVAPNKDLKNRLMEKLKLLTAYLLKITPDEVLAALLKEATAVGFGAVVQAEDDRRNKRNISLRVYGRINRGMTRLSDGAELQREMVKELTVIDGLFMLVKAQFDATMSYYSAHMKNWPAVRDVVENTAEFRDYLVPKNLADVVKDIAEDKEILIEASDAAVDEMKKNDELEKKEEAAVETNTTAPSATPPPPPPPDTKGGGRTRRRRMRYRAIRGSGHHYVHRHAY
jgi:hypothetical protein